MTSAPRGSPPPRHSRWACSDSLRALIAGALVLGGPPGGCAGDDGSAVDVGASTSSGGSDAAQDSHGTASTDDGSSGGTSAEPVAFRFTSLFVRDPHFFVKSGTRPGSLTICSDVTDPPLGEGVNDRINAAIEGDDPASPDGYLDLSLVLVFRPLVQTEGEPRPVELVSGLCTTTSCSARPDADPVPTSYVVMQSGVCHEPDPTHLSPIDYDEKPGTTEAPCFRAGPTDFTIVSDEYALQLTGVEVAAQFVGDSADEVINGTMRGHLSTAVAQSTMWYYDGLLSELLAGSEASGCGTAEELDGDGWWVYLDFTAQRVPWTAP